MAKKYNIGLDIGTNSVGWAVVEAETQKIIRKGKGRNAKRLWGVRLFDTANTAEERRKFRSTRRRYDRRRERISLLQQEFETEINKVDPDFYQKMKESFYNEKDNVNKKIILSNIEKKLLRDYQNKYKTIYHLREELINNKSKFDIRLVYLAIHHIIKYRGNFLYNNAGFSVNDLNIKEKLISSFKLCDIYYDTINYNKLEEAIFNPSKNDRKIIIKKELENWVEKDFLNEFIKMLNGNKFNFTKMLNIDIEEKIELSFNGNDFDDKFDEICLIIGDDIEKLESFKELYDAVFLKRLFNGSNTTFISSLMVEKYKAHEKDLRFLKNIFSVNRTLYRKVFKNYDKNLCLYERYIKNNISYDEFIRELNKLFALLFKEKINQNLLEQYTVNIKSKIENGEFLPRITDTDNGKYPYQLNKEELVKIIENQGKYYPFLLEKTSNGKYKLVQLLEFKIPYYIGPLVSEKKSNFAWMTKKVENVKITPYNFDDIVNKEETAEKFIKRMIKHCTYLLNEYSMPNNSILYSKFKVMNELKQIRINGNKIDNEVQHKIIEELFMTTKSSTITDKVFKEYLKNSKDFGMYNGEFSVTGYSSDGKFANSMKSYVDFFGEEGILKDTEYDINDAEKMIELITIFEDKDILESRIRKLFPDLNNEKIKKILAQKYKGWGSLSKKLLTIKYYMDKKTNNTKSILDLMNETSDNFMQVLNNDEYHFQKMIKEENKLDTDYKINYSLVENLATSPANKRGIYQALKIIDEIVKYMKKEPESIVIEMARGNEKKQRKDDRKKQLLKMYDDAKEKIENYNTLLTELENKEKIDTQKLFLYFIQEGKSLYSGKPLNIENLEQYEIDHIIPRTLIKDDSIDNKALVYSEENQKKSDNYILPLEYRNETNKRWWERLRNIGLLSAKKYHNLIRREYKQDEIDNFINRQIVETRQITKHVANIISNCYKNTEVIYLNASLSHNYREKYELFKFREINDYHHAHDAYLAATLGEYKEKYLRRKIDFEAIKELNSKFLKNKEYKKLQYGYVINSLDSIVNNELKAITSVHIDDKTGEVLFNPDEFNKKIEYNLYCNDIIVSRKTEIRSGQLFKQTIYKKSIGNIELKKNMPTNMYGGYSNIETSYLSLVNYKDKKKLVGIPLQISKKSNETKEEYFKNILNLKNDQFTIEMNYIPFETLINYKDQDVYIKGYSVIKKNCELSNAKQLKIPKDKLISWKYTLNKIINHKNIPIINENSILDLQTILSQSKEILTYLLMIKKEYPLFISEVSKIEQALDIDNLSFEEISKIILELLKLYHCNSENANLKEFGLGDRIGRLSGKNIDSGTFIFKSTTGIMESRYEF